MRPIKNFILNASISLLFLSLIGCASLPQFTSERCSKKIVVDGDNSEWSSIPAYIDKNNVLAVSVCHDDEYVYVCLMTQDPLTQRQIMGGGLTVWFDRSGSDDKTYGINYPLARHSGDSWQRVDEEIDKDSGTVKYTMDQPSHDMEIIGPKETDRYRISILNNEGIQVRIGRSKGNEMVYELQVPLKKSVEHPRAIEPKDEFIGLGFETGPIAPHSDKHSDDQSSPLSEGGMGRGHRGGGSSGGWRSHQGGGQRSGSMPEPLKLWWKVKL